MNDIQIAAAVSFVIAPLVSLLCFHIRDRRAQRREDLAKIDFIARRWKSMDQPRDRKTGRFMRKVKI